MNGTRPFLVVTPLGLQTASAFDAALNGLGIVVTARQALGDWSHAATRLYARLDEAEAADRAARFEEHWRRNFPADIAEVWMLRSMADHSSVVRAKPHLRRRFASIQLPLHPSDPVAFRLHAFHVPDREDLLREHEALTLTRGWS